MRWQLSKFLPFFNIIAVWTAKRLNMLLFTLIGQTTDIIIQSVEKKWKIKFSNKYKYRNGCK